MTHDEIDQFLEEMDATNVRDIQLEEVMTRSGDPMFRATCGRRWAFVDRSLARDLRQLGAGWRGDVLRDPCAVA